MRFEELDVGEQRENRRSAGSLPGLLASMTCGLLRDACWN